MATWQSLYPESEVWIRNKDWRDTFYLTLLARADVIDPESPVLIYPLQQTLDERLPMKSFVLGVEIDNQHKAYPVSIFENESLLHDEMGTTSLLLVSARKNDYMQIFDRNVSGQTLTFALSGAEGNFKDNETGSQWTPQGMCIAGDYEDTQLVRIPHYNKIFWFVWADYHPETTIFGADAVVGNIISSAA